jgi:hypothetical protein
MPRYDQKRRQDNLKFYNILTLLNTIITLFDQHQHLFSDKWKKSNNQDYACLYQNIENIYSNNYNKCL